MEKGKLTLDSSTKKKILTTKDGKKIELYQTNLDFRKSNRGIVEIIQ